MMTVLPKALRKEMISEKALGKVRISSEKAWGKHQTTWAKALVSTHWREQMRQANHL